MSNPKRPAVFLDRDGTINREVNFLHRVEDLNLLPQVPEALIKLKQAGFALVVVTNQSGVARGIYGMEEVGQVHRALDEMLAQKGASLDAYYVCPHHPKEGKVPRFSKVCGCRKPLPGLLLRAAEDMGLDLGSSYMIGDRKRDVAAGLAAGCTSLMVTTGQDDGPAEDPSHTPDFVAHGLLQAAEWIIAHKKAKERA
ncbi:D-glycero-alpha-D-manno-heptose-1,7-bisphosphate 7-phosphatase [Dethiosulfatarculus sandiegensis]|uniref:D,D-heptose 1,7-bisphosphate phosphatase n=1 Tax=Dethiosulfatarculus sandiegensis TaxID=1429043 RepID=A0A0D2JTR4_9BACT|nr:HAD family hydrolase [Dethiosulfatarculus sandiegensis]KIX12890.1 HAD family hydrolase [Dethiosulfatarculus sandiegensis]